MALNRIVTVTATGIVVDPTTGNPYFLLPQDGSDFFLGIGGTYSGLTLQIQGSRGNAYYDLAAYTTDNVGPLATPLSPADNAEIAYIGDCRAFTQLQVTVLGFTTLTALTLEVLAGSFFPPRAGQLSAGTGTQVVQELRNILAVLQGYYGYANAQILQTPPALVGSGVGQSFPGGN